MAIEALVRSYTLPDTYFSETGEDGLIWAVGALEITSHKAAMLYAKVHRDTDRAMAPRVPPSVPEIVSKRARSSVEMWWAAAGFRPM